jgi:hypothetical protein
MYNVTTAGCMVYVNNCEGTSVQEYMNKRWTNYVTALAESLRSQ